MKSILKFLPLLALLAACGGQTDETIRDEVFQKKNEITKLEQQIVDLEKLLTDTTDQVKHVPVSVKTMKKEEFHHYIIVYGNVEADKYANISPEMGGQISKILVDEGQYVTKGDLLISLNTAAIAGQIKATRSGLELANKTYEKQNKLWEQKIGSEIQYLQAKSTKESLEANLEALEAQMRMSQIRAPFSGTVNKISPKVGEVASPGFPVLEMVNLSKMTIKADVSESYIESVKKGQLVEVSFSSLPDMKVKTTIKRLSKVINPKSRTFEIELNVNNANEQIKPNMVSTIRINDFSKDEAFIIPSLAIRKDITGRYVYVVENNDGADIVAKKYIETGKSFEDNTMVTRGMNLNDKVVVNGFHMVSSGLPVRIVD